MSTSAFQISTKILLYFFQPIAGNETLAVALDILKAFDMVQHKNLFAKLTFAGLAPKLCKLSESFLSDRSITVVVDEISSSSFHTNAGVHQGSVISPTLFLIYINDLLNLPSNPVHCYADDSTLHNAPASHKNRADFASSINLDLWRIKNWGSQNLVNSNAVKTQRCLISRRADRNLPDISFDSNSLEFKDNISMLGVTLGQGWANTFKRGPK